VTLETKIDIDAPADAAWEVLGERFGEIAEWTSSITVSSLNGELQVGGTRTCENSRGFGPFKPGIIEERLVIFDRSSMTFEYEGISGLPGMLRKAGNHWTVQEVDEDHCVVRSEAHIELKGFIRVFAPFMRLAMKSAVRKFTEELRFRVSNGYPHPDAATPERINTGPS